MSLDVKTKCKHCGKVFAVRKGFLYEHPYAETKEEWEEAAFISEGSGIEAFCPACRKYEIMIQYKRERRLHDFAELSEILDGFIYVGKIKDRKMWINNIPEEKGVYAITRETTAHPSSSKSVRVDISKRKILISVLRNLQKNGIIATISFSPLNCK